MDVLTELLSTLARESGGGGGVAPGKRYASMKTGAGTFALVRGNFG